MRFDLISIFPQYFNALDLSLVGKAQKRGSVTVTVHDLRNWASGTHRSVDEAPFGGGAGMVMRPDVWGKALDSVLDPGSVLVIPTPAGRPLTQEMLADLAQEQHLVVACGRYEGIDARVAEHYRAVGHRVVEFSLGDYVVNGGEVAALALVEGVGRLVDGVVGNPESLVEESHQEPVLEYPAYTQPREWRGLAVPNVLLSGNHAQIARWRRDEALARTADVRPDLVARLGDEPTELSRQDRDTLARQGHIFTPRRARVSFEQATSGDLAEISKLAGELFPLACPPGLDEQEISKYVEEELNADTFARLVDEGGILGKATVSGQIVGYTLVAPHLPDDIPKPSSNPAYLSKIYVSPDWHGSGISAALMSWAQEQAVAHWQADSLVLGTNRANKKAVRFYKAIGFTRNGRRTFMVGDTPHDDYVFVREITR